MSSIIEIIKIFVFKELNMKTKLWMWVCGLSFFAALSVRADEAPHLLEPYCYVSMTGEYISLGKFPLPSSAREAALPVIYSLLPKLQQTCANYGVGNTLLGYYGTGNVVIFR